LLASLLHPTRVGADAARQSVSAQRVSSETNWLRAKPAS
jgi:hypothetical protein